ncbi:serine/threonine-protein kinase pkga-related [Anaeramoeba flamelloides]|uniref:non-specific serine/threonine protein kinase n=1 Tax=Anaeramoeba flamelloides TaxID=1746091 RepID=A0AAV7Z1E9_9EUKA|nr:serine/threonine-protein kinase pkga-related [Anaeramoeba flamelloides]
MRKNLPSLSDFEIINQISRGAYGQVFLSMKKDTKDIYAIKVLKKKSMILKNQVKHINTEKHIMSKTGNHFIVKLYYSFQSENNLYLLMEFCPGGDLFALLATIGYLNEQTARFYIAEIILAVEFLHKHGIVHRDLKPDNLLIDKNGHLKLTDFGLSKIGLYERREQTRDQNEEKKFPNVTKEQQLNSIEIQHDSSITFDKGNRILREIFSKKIQNNEEKEIEKIMKNVNINKEVTKNPNKEKGDDDEKVVDDNDDEDEDDDDDENSTINNKQKTIINSSKFTSSEFKKKPKFFSFVGTPAYLAPEILLGQGHSFEVDWWALGIITYEFVAGYPPFGGEEIEEIFQNILDLEIEYDEYFSPELKDFISKLLVTDPNKRLGTRGSSEIKNHPWFKGIDWDNLYQSKPAFVPKVVNNHDLKYFKKSRYHKENYVDKEILEEMKNAKFDESLISSQESNVFDKFSSINWNELYNLNLGMIEKHNSSINNKN